MGPHKNLDAWRKSIQLVDEIYRVTRSFPQDELFCLVTQMRRAAISIPSDIAEGYGRSSNSEVIRFLYNSLGSSNELDTQIILSRRQSLINDVDFAIVEGLNDEVHKMLQSLIYVRKRQQI